MGTVTEGRGFQVRTRTSTHAELKKRDTLLPIFRSAKGNSREHRGGHLQQISQAGGTVVAERSTIEWTDATWNPVRGCTKISPGCKHCYAETFAERFRGVKGHPYEQGFDLRLVPEKLYEPLRWRSPKRIFVNSMSDLFHDAVPDSYIESVAEVMVEAYWHTYQVLTKRSARLRDLLKTKLQFAATKSHIWWGTSVEDKKYGLSARSGAAHRSRGLHLHHPVRPAF